MSMIEYLKTKTPHIILSVIFMATFITIFYFAYVVKVEEEIVKKQITYLSEDLFGSSIDFLSDDKKKALKFALEHTKRPDFTAADKEVENSNTTIFHNTIKYLIILNVVGIAIAYFISKRNQLDFKEILKDNFIILIFIAITELSFLKIFVTDFISINPNEVKLGIINKIFPDNAIKR